MITNERIDELLRQKAKIWGVGKQGNVFCVGLKFRPETLKNKKWLENKYEVYSKFFETEEDAKWFAEFGCIERTERLELPTWEEFIKFGENSHYGFNEIKRFDNVWFGYCCRPDGSDGSLYIDKDGETMFLTSMITKENYTLACRKCKELFLGEKK